MLALYRSGRQADALAEYAEIRRLLTNDLGLEPSDELRALQRQILEHAPKLGAPARVNGGAAADVERSRLAGRSMIAAVGLLAAGVAAAGLLLVSRSGEPLDVLRTRSP